MKRLLAGVISTMSFAVAIEASAANAPRSVAACERSFSTCVRGAEGRIETVRGRIDTKITELTALRVRLDAVLTACTNGECTLAPTATRR